MWVSMVSSLWKRGLRFRCRSTSRGGSRGRWNLNQEDELRDIPIDAPLAPVTPDNLAVVVADNVAATPEQTPNNLAVVVFDRNVAATLEQTPNNLAVPRLFPLDVDRDSERDRVIDECPHYWQKRTGVDRRRCAEPICHGSGFVLLAARRGCACVAGIKTSGRVGEYGSSTFGVACSLAVSLETLSSPPRRSLTCHICL